VTCLGRKAASSFGWRRKNEDLTTLYNDMLTLLDSTDVASLFLDEKLRIRRFTPAAARLFQSI
jgi:two-component system CheB/CheR fusion protein